MIAMLKLLCKHTKFCTSRNWRESIICKAVSSLFHDTALSSITVVYVWSACRQKWSNYRDTTRGVITDREVVPDRVISWEQPEKRSDVACVTGWEKKSREPPAAAIWRHSLNHQQATSSRGNRSDRFDSSRSLSPRAFCFVVNCLCGSLLAATMDFVDSNKRDGTIFVPRGHCSAVRDKDLAGNDSSQSFPLLFYDSPRYLLWLTWFIRQLLCSLLWAPVAPSTIHRTSIWRFDILS